MSYAKKQLQVIKERNYDLFDTANIFPELLSNSDIEIVERIREAEEIGEIVKTEIKIEKEPEKELPTVSELYEIFDKLNIKLFDNQIPRLNIRYSKRMLIAGSYSPIKKEIKMGWRYHLIFRDDIEDTMAHEMIHYFYPNHGQKFKDMANKLGVSLKAKEHPDLRLACRYLYYCPNCGKEYPRRKRLRMASCGSCTTGRSFNARFKLKLKKK